MAFSLKKYYEPTPTKWRKLGDALLSAALAALPFVQSGNKLYNYLVAALIAGKFITNFLGEQANDDSQNNSSKSSTLH